MPAAANAAETKATGEPGSLLPTDVGALRRLRDDYSKAAQKF